MIVDDDKTDDDKTKLRTTICKEPKTLSPKPIAKALSKLELFSAIGFGERVPMK